MRRDALPRWGWNLSDGGMHMRNRVIRRAVSSWLVVSLAAVGVATALAGCGPAAHEEIGEGLLEHRTALGGAGIIEADGSRASNIQDVFGIAGTVPVVKWGPVGNERSCSGVLIDRGVVLTSAGCATGQVPVLGNFLPRVRVVFPQEPTVEFTPRSVALRTQDGLAVLRLEEEVPSSIVEKIAPVFSGDVEIALATGHLDPSSGVLVGVGPTDASATDGGVRRAGEIRSATAFKSFSPYILANLDPAQGATMFPDGDLGAPLFLWDTWAQRYVLVGLPADDQDTSGSTAAWMILGKAEASGIDKWEILRSLWYDPKPPTPFIYERLGNDPGGSWVPALGFDRDDDGVLDGADNCAPELCSDRWLDQEDCRNSDQRDGVGDGVGDLCRRMSDPSPPYCRGLETPPSVPGGSYASEWLSFGWREAGWNSNVDVEEALMVSAKADMCEPVPQLRFMEMPPVVPLGMSNGRPVMPFAAQPILGGGSWDPSLIEDVDFRFCSCIGAPSRDDCVQSLGCNPATIRKNELGVWKGGLSVSGPRTHSFHEYAGATPWPTPSTFDWNWVADAQAGRIPASPQEKNIRAKGFFATTVLGDTWQSARDERWEGALRSVVGLGEVAAPDPSGGTGGTGGGGGEGGEGNWKDYEIDTRDMKFGKLYEGIPPCDPNPLKQLVWFSFLPFDLRLGDHLMQEVSRDPLLTFVDAQSGRIFGARTWSSLVDFSGVSDPSLSVFLASGGPAEVFTPTEPASALAAFGVRYSGLAVATCPGTDAQLISGDQAMAVTSLGFKLQLTEGTRVVLSGLENVAYMVKGSAGAAIQRIHLASGATTSIHPARWPPGPDVLGLAYDPGTSTLFVLDTSADEKEARLVAHGLVSGASNLLWTLPYHGQYQATSLDVAENGDLMLTVGSSQSFSSWRMDPSTGAFLGRIDGQGEMVRFPAMGWHFPSLHYKDSRGWLQLQTLEPWRYQEGAPCTSL